jgi:cytochrome P450
MTTSTPAPPDLFSPEHFADPWPGFAILRDHYPVHLDETLGVWLISRYSDVRPLGHLPLGDLIHELLGQYLGDATGILTDGADHRRKRALLAPVFARGGVERFSGQVEKHAHAILDPIFERERTAIEAGERTRGEMDFVTEFTASFSANVMLQILDLPLPDASRMKDWFSAWINAEGNIARDPEIITKALQTKEEFTAVVQPVIQERRTGDGDDLITQLCQAELDGFSLSDAEVQSFIAAMFLAGGETTDHQLGWIMYELTRHPEVQQAMLEDPSLVTNVLAESMRYHAIIPFGSRPAPADLEIDGVSIEEGAQLAIMFGAGNHDPRRFENPDEFDIYRSDVEVKNAFNGAADHLGFGAGPHFCIGSHLTKAEMETALDVFFEHARDVRLTDGPEPTASLDSPYVRALTNLKITFDLA